MDFSEVSLSKATIQTDKLLENIASFKSLLTAPTKFMAVIKANAYSHGAVPLAHKMEEAAAADYFGVAQLSEALTLRSEGIETPILVFNSVRAEEIERAIKENIIMTVFSTELALETAKVADRLGQTAKVHINIDTGMARLGVTTYEEALAVYEALDSVNVHVEGIYTHYADAYDDDADNFSHEQFARFKDILDQFEVAGIEFDLRHTCNTAATINFPDYHLDMVRVGFGLHGLDPTTNDHNKIKLTPTETVTTTVTHVKDFPANESVGYERTFYSERPMRIATIAIGYADGVAKSLANKGYFTYKGQKLPILGEVCMDQIMIDSSGVDELVVGSEVTYYGNPEQDAASVDEVAEIANASPYDLLCRIGNRVRRVYV